MVLKVEGVAPFELERLGDLEVPGYPVHEETLQFENTATIGPAGVATKTSQRSSGRRLRSEDGLQSATMTDEVFAFSRLAPYETWSAFSDEGLRLWDAYASKVQPDVVSRLGLRYINQIKRPAVEIDLRQYLRTRPEISDDMPNTMVGFFLSMDIPMPEHGATCRLTETVIRPTESEVALVLDIDVGRPGQYDPTDRHELRSVLDVLREAKNVVFEASITEAARELFN